MKLHHPLVINLLRVVQFLAAIATCGLCAWSAAWYGLYLGYYVAFWSSIWTMIFMVFRAIEHCTSSNALHIIALAIEALIVLSWLVSTVTLGLVNSTLGNWEKQWEQQINIEYNGSSLNTVFTDTGRASLHGSYAANALAAGLFVSFVITFATYLHTYHKAKRAHLMANRPMAYGEQK